MKYQITLQWNLNPYKDILNHKKYYPDVSIKEYTHNKMFSHLIVTGTLKAIKRFQLSNNLDLDIFKIINKNYLKQI
jgi:hypothetical protein